jgi:three-Cys-motif partner protein
MPIKKLQGQSEDATEIKQRGLSFAFRVGLAVVQKHRYPYFHFDLHAGSGYNIEADCIGSPLAFLSEVRRANCENYFAGFCDKDKSQVKTLLSRPELDHERCRIFHGDNAEFVRMIPAIITHNNDRIFYATGSVLSDPNGADVPIDELSWLARTCPRIDTILHWNSTIIKRLRNGIKPTQISLKDAIRQIGKTHWLIREPAGIHQFTMLIGRSYRFNDWPAMGFYHLDSAKGQDILQRCDSSKRGIERLQSQAQRALFDDPLSNI